MNYELAKSLRDAGFPEMGGWVDGATPTLEELIEAIIQGHAGGNFHIRNGKYSDGVWKAEVFGSNRRIGIGSTPTEAVARLWLALQTKAK
jgi:hypothetical protein